MFCSTWSWSRFIHRLQRRDKCQSCSDGHTHPYETLEENILGRVKLSCPVLAPLAFHMALPPGRPQVTFLWIRTLSQGSFCCGHGHHSPVYSTLTDKGQGSQGSLEHSLLGFVYKNKCVCRSVIHWAFSSPPWLWHCLDHFLHSCLFSEIPQGVFQCDAPVWDVPPSHQ